MGRTHTESTLTKRRASALPLTAAILLLTISGCTAPAADRPNSASPPSLAATAEKPAPPLVDRSSEKARQLVAAAHSQVGVTVHYDPAYVALGYPGGDVPRERGVCTDVVIRALRDALGQDLQVAVHEDMSAAFAEYPDRWGLERPDRNIDHRRVPNLQTYFERKGFSVGVSGDPADYWPGDIVTWDVAGRPHIGIVSTSVAPAGERFCIVHNIGRGTRVEDMLFNYEITGHYRPL